jgi:ArsR family transcriptional regulator
MMDGCSIGSAPAFGIGSAVEVLHLFGDPTRVRLVSILSRFELTVVELTLVLDLAQSRVSTHLGKLREAGVLRDRRVGVSSYYSLNDGAMPDSVRKVWSLLESDVDDPVLTEDRARAERLITAREQADGWPDSVAGQMERYYSPGRTWEALARGLLGLIELGDVLDAGAGDGTVAQLLAPRSRSYTCYDRSVKLIAAARQRLGDVENACYQIGDLHALPYAPQSFDQVLLLHVLTSIRSPGLVLGECARVLRPGGRLVAVTLESHRHEQVTAAYHHLHAGFAPKELRRLVRRAGLEVERCEVTSRERRKPYFQVISLFATRARTQGTSRA